MKNNRKKHVLIAWLCRFLTYFTFGSLLTAAETNGYVGAVGGQRMILSLTWHDNGTVGGNYYCPGGSGRIYALRGSNPRQGELILTEYTDGKASATCTLKKITEKGVIVWRGTMYNFDGRNKVMYFYRSKD